MIQALRLNWSAEVESLFQPVLRGAGQELALQIRLGIAEVWQIRKLYLITRVEQGELVICCAIGEGLRELAPLIHKAAIQKGCKTIRFHSLRPGLARMLKSWGFEEVERVYRMEIDL